VGEGQGTGVDLGIDGITEAVAIGQGSYGIVYRAVQADYRRTVAVKLLTTPMMADDDRHDFELECQALGSLSSHPNIVSLYFAGVTNAGNPYMIMDFLTGGSLGRRLDTSGPLPWGEAVAVGVKIAGALATAHQSGILHRDVKPDNVLMSGYGEPQLADFGVARIQGGTSHTMAGTITGSLVHASPEVISGIPATPAADIWSLASTIATLLIGQPPFHRDGDETLSPLITRILTADPPDLRTLDVPEPVCAAIATGLAKDSWERPETADAFGRLLQDAQRAAGMEPTPMAFAGVIGVTTVEDEPVIETVEDEPVVIDDEPVVVETVENEPEQPPPLEIDDNDEAGTRMRRARTDSQPVEPVEHVPTPPVVPETPVEPVVAPPPQPIRQRVVDTSDVEDEARTRARVRRDDVAPVEPPPPVVRETPPTGAPEPRPVEPPVVKPNDKQWQHQASPPETKPVQRVVIPRPVAQPTPFPPANFLVGRTDLFDADAMALAPEIIDDAAGAIAAVVSKPSVVGTLHLERTDLGAHALDVWISSEGIVVQESPDGDEQTPTWLRAPHGIAVLLATLLGIGPRDDTIAARAVIDPSELRAAVYDLTPIEGFGTIVSVSTVRLRPAAQEEVALSMVDQGPAGSLWRSAAANKDGRTIFEMISPTTVWRELARLQGFAIASAPAETASPEPAAAVE
jgi:serine/threonine protein kinase